MAQLAKNFTLAELTRTNHRGLLGVNRAAAGAYLEELGQVAAMLQTIRDHYLRPVIVHSGFRCSLLNTAIGGSKRSQHMLGQAADFHVSGITVSDAFGWIWRSSGLAWGQLIAEGAVRGRPTWIHMSLGAPWLPAARCGQVLTWDDGGYRRLR